MQHGYIEVIGYDPSSGEPIVGWFGSDFVKSATKVVKKAAKVVKKAAPVAALTIPAVGVPLTLATHHKPKELVKLGQTYKKYGKVVVRSPLAKATAAGLAFVVPPVGVPLTAGMVAADKVIAAVERGEAAAKKIIQVTHALTKDPKATPKEREAAKRGLAVLATAKRQRLALRRVPSKKGQQSADAILVTKDGVIVRGNFQRV